MSASDQLIDDYLQHLRLERGLSLNSITAYRRDLLDFVAAIGIMDISSVQPSAVSKYIDFLSRKGRKPTTIARKISALKRFFAYLKQSGRITTNPVNAVSAPRISRYHPSYLSASDIARVIETIGKSRADAARPLSSARDRAMIELLYGSGLRISELISLRLKDIEFEAGFIRVEGKGNKQRLVPIGDFAARALKLYLESRSPQKVQADSPLAFPNVRGKLLSRVAVWKMIRRRVVAAGITKPVSPHTFRHSFATHMLEGGADLRVVQEMLGHADISTTQVYLTIDRDYIIAEHRKYHPRELAGTKDK